MLQDPLVLTPGQTVTFGGGVASNFRRTAFGKYSGTDGAYSTTQPARLTISSNPKVNGPSSYRFRMEVDKDVAPINGVAQSDDTLVVDIKITGNLRSFSANNVNDAYTALYKATVLEMARILGGES